MIGMIKFVDMTPTLRAADPQASPACAFLNTETGRFCEHGGTGEHLFTSADDITRHGPPARVGVPLGFFGRPADALRWADVPIRSLVLCVDDNDIAFKHADGGLEWVRIGGHGTDSEPGQWWPARASDLRNNNVSGEYGWAIIATGLRGDETVAELQALAGVSS